MASMVDRTATCRDCGNDFTYRRARDSGGRPRWYCDSCLVAKDGRSKRKFTFYLSVEDWELVSEIQNKLGVDVSEAVRTSIRLYSALLKK